MHGNFQKTKFCQFLLFPAVKISAKIEVKFLFFALFFPKVCILYIFEIIITWIEDSIKEIFVKIKIRPIF